MGFLFGPLFSESNAVLNRCCDPYNSLKLKVRAEIKLRLSHTLRYVSYMHREASVKETVYLSYF